MKKYLNILKLSTFYLIALSPLQAQLPEGIYINSDDELLVVSSDTLSYRLMNRGGVITYSIGKGVMQHKKNKVKILHHALPTFQISSQTNSGQEDSLFVCVQSARGADSALEYEVWLESRSRLIVGTLSDEYGCATLPNEKVKRKSQLYLCISSHKNSQCIEITNTRHNSFIFRDKVEKDISLINTKDSKRTCLQYKQVNETSVKIYDEIYGGWKTFQINRLENADSELILK